MDDQNSDQLNNSIDGEFASEQDELNKSTTSTNSEAETEEKKRRTQTPSPHRYPPAFVNVPGTCTYIYINVEYKKKYKKIWVDDDHDQY